MLSTALVAKTVWKTVTSTCKSVLSKCLWLTYVISLIFRSAHFHHFYCRQLFAGNPWKPHKLQGNKQSTNSAREHDGTLRENRKYLMNMRAFSPLVNKQNSWVRPFVEQIILWMIILQNVSFLKTLSVIHTFVLATSSFLSIKLTITYFKLARPLVTLPPSGHPATRTYHDNRPNPIIPNHHQLCWVSL